MTVDAMEVQQLVDWGFECAPYEAVGVFLDSPRHMPRGRLYRIEAQTPTVGQVEITPQEIIEAIEWLMPENGSLDESELVLWHTHPHGMIGPSEMDIRHRTPGRHMVITIPTGEVVEY